jgi:hypothetical protein
VIYFADSRPPPLPPCPLFPSRVRDERNLVVSAISRSTNLRFRAKCGVTLAQQSAALAGANARGFALESQVDKIGVRPHKHWADTNDRADADLCSGVRGVRGHLQRVAARVLATAAESFTVSACRAASLRVSDSQKACRREDLSAFFHSAVGIKPS